MCLIFIDWTIAIGTQIKEQRTENTQKTTALQLVMVTSSCPGSFGHYFSSILEVSLGRVPWGLDIFDTIINACGITVLVSRPLD